MKTPPTPTHHMIHKKVQKKAALIAGAEAELIKRIRAKDNLSRIELSHALTLSPATVGHYVDRLLHEGFLLSGVKHPTGMGRPRTGLTLNPAIGQFIGVDFYADEILAVSIDFAQNIIQKTTRSIHQTDTPADITQGILSAIETVAPADPTQLLGIGIGSPGTVDCERGIALEYNYIPDFHNVPLIKPIQKQFHVPIHIENTANAMALAELWFGQGRDLNAFACLWLRSGIGAGIIINRQLYSGCAAGAGEIGFGQCPVYEPRSTPDPHPTFTGNLCDLEEIASVRAIHNALKQALTVGETTSLRHHTLDTEHIIQAYRDHDRLTRSIIHAAAHSLGWGIAHLSFCLAPERVILAGPLAALGADFLHPIRETTAACFAKSGLLPPPVTLSTLGSYSGALGAAALAVDRWKPIR